MNFVRLLLNFWISKASANEQYSFKAKIENRSFYNLNRENGSFFV